MKRRLRPTLAAVLLCLAGSAPALPLYRDSLPNGLIVLTFEDSRLPMVDVALVCRSGAAFDPAGKAGVAALTGHLLTRGTPRVSGDSVSSIVEFLGARFDGNADFDQSSLRLRVLSKDLAAGLDLLAAGVLNPALTPKEFRLALDQAMTAARRAYDYPSFVVSDQFDRMLYPNHPYACPSRGDTATLRRVTRDDVARFHKEHYVPNNCFIVAVGDVDRAALTEALRSRFGDWQPRPLTTLTVPALSPSAGIKARLINRSDMNQTYVEFGHPGISMLDADMLPTRLMSYILGGGAMSSRLGLSVREEGGLAYDVRCWFDRMKLRGGFHATVQTARPREAIALMLRDIRSMRDSGATSAELLKAHNYYTGSFPLTYSSNRGKLNQVINQELFGFGTDWLERFPADVRAVTLEQVNAAALSHLDPGNYYMVIMGPVTKDDLGLDGVEWIE